MTMTALHNFLTELYADVRGDSTGAAANRLAYATLENVAEYTTGGSGRAMRAMALDAVENVLDIAANQGTSEDMWELTRTLDHSAGTYGPNPEDTQNNDVCQRALGELWNHNFTPGDVSDDYGRILDSVLGVWCSVLSDAAQSAVLAYVESNWEAEDDTNA